MMLNLELSQDLRVVLVTCKNEEDSIKNEGARVFTTLYIGFSDGQGHVRDIIIVLVTCKHKEDLIKNEGTSVFTTFSPL